MPRRPISGRSKIIALLAVIVVPFAISDLAPMAASAAGPDTIQFTQTSGSSKAYFKYVPGDGSTATTQNITGGGGCSSPTLGNSVTGKTQGTTDALLGWAAGVWSSQTTYAAGGRSNAIVGAYNGETGVCAEGANFAIDNVPAPHNGNSSWGLEALDFTKGSNAVDKGRDFSRATINIANNNSTATTVHLVETLNGVVEGSQDCPLAGTAKSNSPAIVAADTKVAGSACTGTDPSFSGFDTIEIQVPNPGESVSVVQTSTFYLGGGKVCGGQTINATDQSGTSGGISASLTLVGPSTDCKYYNSFAVSSNDPDPNASGFPKAMIFSGVQGDTLPAGDHMITTIDWGPEPECAPTQCQPTQISFDGTHYVPQTFCAAADPTNTTTPWCTTSQKFSYVTVNGVTMTDITETWDGTGDPTGRRPLG